MTSPITPWATEVFGLAVSHVSGSERVPDLVLPGLRRNPRRAHLLVSTVLGKHIPLAPDGVVAAGRRLASAVAKLKVGAADVIGMAETATALGHCVADGLDAYTYMHSTRRDAPPEQVYAAFTEEHSHATVHTLQPSGPELFDPSRTMVLVDDEISTGGTALATIVALQQIAPRQNYVVAALVDLRTERHRVAVTAAVRDLGTRVAFVSLARGQVELPPGLVDEVCALPAPPLNLPGADVEHGSAQTVLPWPSDVPEGGRHGFLYSDRPAFDGAVVDAADRLAALLDRDRSVLVVGHEELMYLPLKIAERLTRIGFAARFQSTTRSPAYVLDDPGYPLRRGWTFPACEPDDVAPRFLYNGWPTTRDGGPTQLVLLLDAVAAAGNRRVVEVLSAAGYEVLVAVVHAPDSVELARLRGHG